MSLEEIISALGHPVSIELMIALYVIRKLALWLGKPDWNEYLAAQASVESVLGKRLEEIGRSFNAQRVHYWGLSNGEKYISNWPKKKLTSKAEWFDSEVHKLSFKDAFTEVPATMFDRNMNAMRTAFSLKKGNQTLLWTDEQTQGELFIFPSGIFSKDESIFNDLLGKSNTQWGFRSLAACYITNRRGKELGILVLGWNNPREFESLNVEQFKSAARTLNKIENMALLKNSFKSWMYYKVIERIMR